MGIGREHNSISPVTEEPEFDHRGGGSETCTRRL